MACSTTLSGITLDCQSSMGGIKEVWITEYSNIGEIEYDNIPDENSAEKTYGKIISLGIGGTNQKDLFKHYAFRKQTGSMTSTLNVDEVAGINYVSTELNLVFTKMETTKRLEMSALAIGQLAVIVRDSNNCYWFLGEDDYVSASAGSGNTGTAKGDSNNYSITLKAESDTFPKEISDSYLVILGIKTIDNDAN